MEVDTILIREVLRAGEAAANHIDNMGGPVDLLAELDAAMVKLRPIVYPETAAAHKEGRLMKTAEDRIAEAVEKLSEYAGLDQAHYPLGRTICREALRILQPQPVRHTLGGVVFEETGERRGPMSGEWFLVGGGAVSCNNWDHEADKGYDFPILRPVAIEEQA